VIRKKKGDGEAPSEWKGRIDRSKKFQERHSKTWKRNEKLLFGAIKGDDSQENELAYCWGLVKALETAIYVQNPEAIVEAYDDAEMLKAKLWSSLVNYDFDQMELKAPGNLMLIDNFVNGYGAIIESLDNERNEVEDEAGETYTTVQGQEYQARRIVPKDILFDPQGTRIDLSDHRYVACAWYPTISQLREYKDFDLPDDIEEYPESFSEMRRDPKSAAKYGDTSAAYPRQKERDPAFRTICIWEIWDKVNKKLLNVTDYKFKEIGKTDWPAKFKIGARDMFPVTLMAFNPVNTGFYPKPEIDLIANQLILLNMLDNAIYRDTLTKWDKWVSIADLFTPDQIAKLTDPNPKNSVLEADRSTITELARSSQGQVPLDPTKILFRLPNPEPHQDMMAIKEMVKQEINDIVGYGPAERGGLPQTRSAREAVAIKEKLDMRLAKRADAVADFYRLFGAKHIRFLQQTMEIERYARVFSIAKELSAAGYQEYAADDIQGDFNFIVYAGTSAPRSTEAKRNSEMQLFSTLLPLIQNGMIPIEPPLMRLAEVNQWRGMDSLLRNYKPATKALAGVLMALRTKPQEVPPQALLESAAAVVQAVLTPQEIAMLAKATQTQGSANPPGARGDPNPTATTAGTMGDAGTQ
jgi:hypothetical protein